MTLNVTKSRKDHCNTTPERVLYKVGTRVLRFIWDSGKGCIVVLVNAFTAVPMSVYNNNKLEKQSVL